MNLDCALGEEEPLSDLLVRQRLPEEFEDLILAFRQLPVRSVKRVPIESGAARQRGVIGPSQEYPEHLAEIWSLRNGSE